MEQKKDTKITKSTPGYAHTRLEGTCGEDVTVADIKSKYYHSHFGGREAFVSNGRWSVIRHDD